MKYVPLLFSILFLANCAKKTDDFTIDEGKDYFPLEVGKYWLYQVDSIVYDPDIGGTRKDTSTTWVREEIVEVLKDNLDQDYYRVERSIRPDTMTAWQISKVFSLQQTGEFALHTEESLPFISLVFPLTINTDWVPTRFFDPKTEFIIAGETVPVFKDLKSKVTSLAETETIGDFTYQSVATIRHKNSDQNPFEHRLIIEKYAKGIGLVSRTMTIFDSQYCNVEPAPDDCTTIAWEDKAEKGFSLTQTLIEHNF